MGNVGAALKLKLSLRKYIIEQCDLRISKEEWLTHPVTAKVP